MRLRSQQASASRELLDDLVPEYRSLATELAEIQNYVGSLNIRAAEARELPQKALAALRRASETLETARTDYQKMVEHGPLPELADS